MTVVIAVLAAYPLSRYRSRFNQPYLYSILFGTCLPITAIMVPVYSLFVRLGYLDNLVAVTFFLAATSLPMAIWMMKNFMDSVPVSLEEAAWVDGASAMGTLRRIVVPLMRPGIAVVFIFVFIQAWGELLRPPLHPAAEPGEAARRGERLHVLRPVRHGGLRPARGVLAPLLASRHRALRHRVARHRRVVRPSGAVKG